MTKTGSRKPILKLAATAGFASLAFGLIAPSNAGASNPTPTATPSEALSLTIDNAVIDFGNTTDRVTIKCKLEGVTGTNPDGTKAVPADFTIAITITDNRTGGTHSASRSPDVVR